MKSNNTAELREKTADELQTRERELTEQLFKLRFQRATGRIESPAKMRQVRREIARMTLVKLIEDGRIHPSRIEETRPLSKRKRWNVKEVVGKAS